MGGFEQIGVEVLRRVALEVLRRVTLLWVGDQTLGGIYALTDHGGVVVVEEGVVGSAWL